MGYKSTMDFHAPLGGSWIGSTLVSPRLKTPIKRKSLKPIIAWKVKNCDFDLTDPLIIAVDPNVAYANELSKHYPIDIIRPGKNQSFSDVRVRVKSESKNLDSACLFVYAFSKSFATKC
jgi:hypothetical protein